MDAAAVAVSSEVYYCRAGVTNLIEPEGHYMAPESRVSLFMV